MIGAKTRKLQNQSQVTLIKGIKEMASLEGANFDIVFEKSKIYSVKGNRKTEIYVYPAMWNTNDKMIPNGAIPISDKIIVNSMLQLKQFRFNLPFDFSIST